MSFVLGFNAKLYRNTAWPGVYNPPVWDEVPNVRDLTLNGETAEADVTTRGAAGWRQRVATLKDGSITFQMVYDNTDLDYQAFRDAWLNGDTLDVWAASGANDQSSSEGLRSIVQVFNFSRSEELENALLVDVTLNPTFDANPPVWLTGPSP